MDIPGYDSIDQMRQNYTAGQLDIDQMAQYPMQQFVAWFQQAREACPVDWYEVNAASLATGSTDGGVSNRIVLVKGIEEDGVVFYTNYDSAKGRQLAANPLAALTFWWPFLQRQVRLEGTVERTAPGKSADYFHARPRGSQIGAAISPQSEIVPSREYLEQRRDEFASQMGDSEIPCPEYWGGYLVRIHRAEFWQGRENRLHDRIQYVRESNGDWKRHRLAP